MTKLFSIISNGGISVPTEEDGLFHLWVVPVGPTNTTSALPEGDSGKLQTAATLGFR